jgi:hypothetical protein
MRSPLVTTSHETLGSCFASTLKDMLGSAVCESVYRLLERNGISREEICNRFADTVTVLTRVLGTSSRVLVHRTVVEMFRQYSQRADFSYQDSLRDRLIVLKEAVLANHLMPKNRHNGIDFDSVDRTRLTSLGETGNSNGSIENSNPSKKDAHAS